MTRVVVFGGGGFIGSHVLARLSDREVVAPPHGAVDLLAPKAVERTLLPGDVVINAAGYAQATDRTPQGLAKLRSANVEAVASLATVAAQVGVEQLIHISSVAAMGRLNGLGHHEDASGPITSPYAASKRESESLLAEFRSALPITILRPTSVFGEGRGLAANLCRMARLPLLPLPGGGKAMIPFTYVRNVTDAVALCVGNQAVVGDTFIVGDAQSYALRDIVTGLAQRLGSRPRVVPVPPAAAGAIMRMQRYVPSRRVRQLVDRVRLETLTTSVSYSIEKFQLATGYVPRYSLAEALARLADWHITATGAVRVQR